MKKKEVKISIAKKNQIRSMACLHSVCFPSEFAKQMGQGYLLAMYRPYITDISGIAFVAHDSNGHLLGLVIGGSRDIERQFVRRIPQNYTIPLIWGFLVKKEIRHFILSRLRTYLKQGQKNCRRSDAFIPPDTAWLYVICVHPNARSAGIADKLLTAFMEECALHDYKRVALRVSQSNSRAIRCYERNGWETFSVEEGALQMIYEITSDV